MSTCSYVHIHIYLFTSTSCAYPCASLTLSYKYIGEVKIWRFHIIGKMVTYNNVVTRASKIYLCSTLLILHWNALVSFHPSLPSSSFSFLGIVSSLYFLSCTSYSKLTIIVATKTKQYSRWPIHIYNFHTHLFITTYSYNIYIYLYTTFFFCLISVGHSDSQLPTLFLYHNLKWFIIISSVKH